MTDIQELHVINYRTATAFRWIAFLVIGIALYGLGLVLGGINVANAYKAHLSDLSAVTATCSTKNIPSFNPQLL